MVRIAFFAHDERDAAIRRRVRAFQDAGHDIVGLAMRRAERVDDGWNRVDLGRTYDARYAQRAAAVARACFNEDARRAVAEADIVFARNLDMGLCAVAAMRRARAPRPFIYECLDIHRLTHRRDAVGAGVRRLERMVLDASSLLIVSAPAFLERHFERRHAGRFNPMLIENRIAPSPALAPRPAPGAAARIAGDGPLRIGWFGVLRCRRSLALMEKVAAAFGEDVEIVLRGFPDVCLPDFAERVAGRGNILYGGRYRAPDDLAALYADVDLVWAGDFHDADFNSKWLLPNRIYEGGYFATPALVPADCASGAWVAARDAGFLLDEPLEETIIETVGELISARGRVAATARRLAEADTGNFLQSKDEMNEAIARAAKSFDHARPRPRRRTPGLRRLAEN